jgi:hypothetical protein
MPDTPTGSLNLFPEQLALASRIDHEIFRGETASSPLGTRLLDLLKEQDVVNLSTVALIDRLEYYVRVLSVVFKPPAQDKIMSIIDDGFRSGIGLANVAIALETLFGSRALQALEGHTLPELVPQPMKQVIYCPLTAKCECGRPRMCGARHVDKGDFATKPHHTHSCQECGGSFRLQKEATVGVAFIPEFKDP